MKEFVLLIRNQMGHHEAICRPNNNEFVTMTRIEVRRIKMNEATTGFAYPDKS